MQNEGSKVFFFVNLINVINTDKFTWQIYIYIYIYIYLQFLKIIDKYEEKKLNIRKR